MEDWISECSGYRRRGKGEGWRSEWGPGHQAGRKLDGILRVSSAFSLRKNILASECSIKKRGPGQSRDHRS